MVQPEIVRPPEVEQSIRVGVTGVWPAPALIAGDANVPYEIVTVTNVDEKETQ